MITWTLYDLAAAIAARPRTLTPGTNSILLGTNAGKLEDDLLSTRSRKARTLRNRGVAPQAEGQTAMDPNPPVPDTPSPSIWRWVLGFLLVGAAWGLTTPFMRRAAVQKANEPPPPSRAYLDDPNVGWMRRKIWTLLYAVVDLLKRPSYAIPLVINLTGSVWFFLLIGQAGKCNPNTCVRSLLMRVWL